jgi:hypothetical protein
MSQKQAAKVTRPNSQAFGKNFHAAVLQPALADQPQRS